MRSYRVLSRRLHSGMQALTSHLLFEGGAVLLVPGEAVDQEPALAALVHSLLQQADRHLHARHNNMGQLCCVTSQHELEYIDGQPYRPCWGSIGDSLSVHQR